MKKSGKKAIVEKDETKGMKKTMWKVSKKDSKKSKKLLQLTMYQQSFGQFINNFPKPERQIHQPPLPKEGLTDEELKIRLN